MNSKLYVTKYYNSLSTAGVVYALSGFALLGLAVLANDFGLQFYMGFLYPVLIAALYFIKIGSDAFINAKQIRQNAINNFDLNGNVFIEEELKSKQIRREKMLLFRNISLILLAVGSIMYFVFSGNSLKFLQGLGMAFIVIGSIGAALFMYSLFILGKYIATLLATKTSSSSAKN